MTDKSVNDELTWKIMSIVYLKGICTFNAVLVLGQEISANEFYNIS